MFQNTDTNIYQPQTPLAKKTKKQKQKQKGKEKNSYKKQQHENTEVYGNGSENR